MKKDLDKIVRNWFAAREKPDEELQGMARRISEEALRKRRSAPETSRVLFYPAWRIFAYAAGIAVILGLTFFIFTSRDLPYAEPCRYGGIVDLSEDTTERQAKEGMVVFSEMERLFKDNFRWAAYSNGDSKLAIESVYGGVASDSVPVRYRLVVLVRQFGESVWRTSFSKDVFLRSEELAAITSDSKGESDLKLWVLPVDRERIMVEAAFSIDYPVRITSSTSCLLDAGKPVEVLSGREGDVEYRVFQTVAVLENLS